jgi:hypothetical protein
LFTAQAENIAQEASGRMAALGHKRTFAGWGRFWRRAMNAVSISSGMIFLRPAKQFEMDETGETFDRTFKAIVKYK